MSPAGVSAPCPGALPNPEALPAEAARLGYGTGGGGWDGGRGGDTRYGPAPAGGHPNAKGWMAQRELAVPCSGSWVSATNARSGPIPSPPRAPERFPKEIGRLEIGRGEVPLLLAHHEREKQLGCARRGRERPGWSHRREIRVGSTHPPRGSQGRARSCILLRCFRVRGSSQPPPKSGLLCFDALQSVCIPKNPEASDI